MNDLILNQTDKALKFIYNIKGNYRFHVRDFVRWLRSNQKDINFESIREYIIQLNNSDYSASTKRLKKQAVKFAIKKLMQDADIETLLKLDRALKRLDEDAETKSPGVNTIAVGRDKVINEYEYEKLLDRARSDRQRRFIEFLFNTGCRISEVIGIKARDIKIMGNVAYIKVKGKGSRKVKYKVRTVRIPVEMLESIRSTFSSNGNYLFQTSTEHSYNRSYVSNQIKKLCKHVLKRDNLSAHSFRHSFVTLQIKKTQDIKGVSKYVGHSSVSITLDMYCQSELEDNQLFDVYFKYKKVA